MMDDATNGQKLDLHAQRDMNIKVLNDQSATIMNNRSVTVVGGDETRTVQSGNLSETVKPNITLMAGMVINMSEQQMSFLSR